MKNAGGGYTRVSVGKQMNFLYKKCEKFVDNDENQWYHKTVESHASVKCAYLGVQRGAQKRNEEAVSVETLKQSANRVVGTKQVLRALKAGTVARVYVANDSDTFLYQRVTRAAEEAGVPAIRIETMKELGEACCVAVPTAAAGILK